jgi:hypothetical protein
VATEKLFLPGSYRVKGLKLREMDREEHDALLDRWIETSQTEELVDELAGRTLPAFEEEDEDAC